MNMPLLETAVIFPRAIFIEDAMGILFWQKSNLKRQNICVQQVHGQGRYHNQILVCSANMEILDEDVFILPD